MTRDPDKEAKAMKIVTEHDGRVVQLVDDGAIVVIRASRYAEFKAALGSAGFISHPHPRPSTDESTDTNWHKIVL